MSALADLASRLGEAGDRTSAAEVVAEHLLGKLGAEAVRVYVLGPGDLCATCPRARDCDTRDRCLHLGAGVGTFGRPPGAVERIPRTSAPWQEVLEHAPPVLPDLLPPELEAGAGAPGRSALLVRMSAADATVGAVGVRLASPATEEQIEDLQAAAFLAASAFRLLQSVGREGERFRQLLLVNELGHKVTSILNDEVLLRQAALDIRRTFSFHNVMIFMLGEERRRLVLRAQAAAPGVARETPGDVDAHEGIVGRVLARGTTEIVTDVSKDPDFLGWYPDTRSEIAVPIQVGGVVEGVLNVESDRIGAFSHTDRLVLETIASQLAIALENARLFAMVKQREDRYRSLLDSSPGAVFHLDGEGRIVFANPAAEKLTGLPGADLLASEQGIFGLVAMGDHGAIREAIRAALGGDISHDVEFHVRRDGEAMRTVAGSFQPLTREHGAPGGVVLLAGDRTRERELQERLRQWEKLSAIGSLVSGVAHELNNPLAGILGFAQLMLARPHEEWSRQEVEKIEHNARRCQAIVENLLAFARQARMSKRPTDLNELIDSVIRLNEYQLRMDNIEVQRDLDLRIPLLRLDANRWQQVFINLTANAHQAILERDVLRRVIRYETRLKGDVVAIRVHDSGPGIPPDIRARVFEPFFTTKDAGTGLGLGICFGIVAEHGGTIEIDTSVTEGACFLIKMPVTRESEGAPAKSPQEVPGRSRAGLGKRALVVDDEEHVREVVSGTLSNHHYVVDAAHDGEEALERIRQVDYDVILTDVFMPGDLNGVGLYDRLRDERPAAAERIIFLTGNVLNDGIREQIADRCVPCVEKPFDIHALARIVNAVASGEDLGTIAAHVPPTAES